MKPEERSSLRLAISPLTRVNVRDATGSGDGSWTMEGYAAVYETATTLFDIPGWLRVDEEIARGALTGVIGRANDGAELVHLNHGHDMKTAVAASNVEGIGQLELGDDFHGMRFFARVDQEDPDARALAVKMRRGVVAQSSFAFTIGAEEIADQRELDDGTLVVKYRITEVDHLYDVCACAQGAYPTTESHLRSLAAASLRVPDVAALSPDRARELLAGLADRPSSRGVVPPIAPEPAGGGGSQTAARHKAQVDSHYRQLARRTR